MSGEARIAILLVAWLGLGPAADAQVAAPDVQAPNAARVESDIYNLAAPAVFRVEAGLAHGTGFLVDSSGLVITNDHVVSSAEEVFVYLEPNVRVRAAVVQKDVDADLDVLQIAPSLIAGRRPLPLAELPLQLAPGDRIIAFGFPLSQPLTMTAGMVANVRQGAILTDAMVNPGNSGGPVLSLDGRVVAITTFIDQAAYGPGLGGAIRVERAQDLLKAVQGSKAASPDHRALPGFPLDVYRVSLLKAVTDTVDPLLFSSLSTTTAGPFEISVNTPVSTMLSSLAMDRRISEDRRKREEKADVPAAQRYSDPGAMRDWLQYVSEDYAPVVAIKVSPLFGETGGSAFRRGFLTALVGVGGQATVRFQGDVRKVTLLRDGQAVEPLRGGHTPVTMGVNDELVDFSDVADLGYYLFDPLTFRPNAPQRPPTVVLRIEDLKHPSKVREEQLPSALVARLWNDFIPYYHHTQTGKDYAAYGMTKLCAADAGAVAMGGAGAGRVGADSTNCTYVLTTSR